VIIFSFVLTVLTWGWSVSDGHARDDLVAKAQSERELIVYGTALAGQITKVGLLIFPTLRVLRAFVVRSEIFNS
jgi:hypothetical protein